MVALFFTKLEVHKDSQNCRLAQSVNFICGCTGTGYAGANTTTKQVVLAWLPRVSGILSMMVSIDMVFYHMAILIYYQSKNSLGQFSSRRAHCSYYMIH